MHTIYRKQERVKMSEDNKKMEIKSTSGSRTVRILTIVIIVVLLGFGAKTMLDKKNQPKHISSAPAAPTVVLGSAAETDLAVQREYVGKVESIQTVSVKPQVAGEITKVFFKEGSVVKAGQTLFSIDRSQYQATVDLRKAEVAQAAANLDKAQKYYNRLKKSDPRSVSASDVDTAESSVLSGQAALAQAKASLRLAQIDLAHTNITAPITGKIGAALYTKGNYVSQSIASLATIVQMDPIRVSFALPDREYLDQLDMFKKKGSVYEIALRLANGKVLNIDGARDYENNQVDNKTGTMTVAARFKNADGLLIPGSMVRVNTKPTESRIALVIPQSAVLADSAGDFVYMVGSDNTAQQRRIKVGDEYGTMFEVKEGLKNGEKIIVQGLQSVRVGAPVKAAAADASSKSAAELAMESDSDISTSSDSTKEGN